MPEQLAELLWREHIHLPAIVLLSELSAPVSAVTRAILWEGDFIRDYPINKVGSDSAAGKSRAGRTVLLRVPRVYEAIIVPILVNCQSLPDDALLDASVPEARLIGGLPVPVSIEGVRNTAPEVTNVMGWVEAVPAMSLPWQLEVISCRAAILTVPSILIDRERVSMVLVR